MVIQITVPKGNKLPTHVEIILRDLPETLSAVAFDLRCVADAIELERPDKINLDDLRADARALEAVISQLTGVILRHDTAEG